MDESGYGEGWVDVVVELGVEGFGGGREEGGEVVVLDDWLLDDVEVGLCCNYVSGVYYEDLSGW